MQSRESTMDDTHQQRKKHEPVMSCDFPDDALMEILTRLPPNSRRRARLVCRLWRATVDERTSTNLRSRAKPLAFVKHALIDERGNNAWSAHVVDSSRKGRSRKLLSSRQIQSYSSAMAMVGTCNGLLCLCDNKKPGGAVTVVNPVTLETLPIPPLHHLAHDATDGLTAREWHRTYSFAYNEETAQYKILHVPCCLGHGGRFDVVQVFILRESSWRDVPAPGSSCSLCNGLLSIDGVTYWVNETREAIMCLHLWKEHLTTRPLPGANDLGYSFHLTMVAGRLGIAANIYRKNIKDTEESLTKVWVLEGSSWSNCYDMHVDGLKQQLTRPHFAFGQYFLTKKDLSSPMYLHRLTDKQRLLWINKQKKGRVVTNLSGKSNQTFAYVKTKEPLGIYKLSQ